MDEKPRNVLIHIGYHKTASTWLQNTLFTSDNPVFEPLSDKDKGQSTLAEHFFSDEEGYYLSPFDDNEATIQAALNRILDERPALGTKYPVVSHERLTGNPHSGGFDGKKIAEMLKKIFPDGKVMVVIREQKSFILSDYFQYLHIGGTFGLKKYISPKYDGKLPFFSPHHVNYCNLVKAYHDLFGKDNVLVLPYELFRDDPSSFVSRIGEFIGSEVTLEEDLFKKRANKKSHQSVMYYLRCVNVFRRATSANNYSALSNRVTRNIAKLIIKVAGLLAPSFLDNAVTGKLKRQVAEIIGDRYVESNRELSKLIDIDLSEYGYH